MMVTANRIIGLDASLNSTGLAYQAGTGPVVTVAIQPDTKTPRGATAADKAILRAERLRHTRDEFRDWIRPGDMIFAEGLVGHTPSAAILGGIGWLLRVTALDRGATFFDLPPSTVKVFGSGFGNADKNQMAEVVERYTCRVFDTDDELDAFVAFCVGCHLTGRSHPLQDVPAVHTRALDKIDYRFEVTS